MSTAMLGNDVVSIEMADAEGDYGERISGSRKLVLTAVAADRLYDEMRDAQLEKELEQHGVTG